MAFASPSGALAQSADQTVPSPEAAKTTGAQRLARFAVVYEVPENLTDEGKARMLSSIDTQIANAPREEMRDLYIRAREALAVRSTNRAGQSSDRQEADAHSIFGRYMKEGWTTTSDAVTITATGLSKDGRPHTMTVRLNTSPSTVDTPPSGGAPEASAAQSILLTGSNPTGTVRVNVSPDGKQSNIYGSSSFIGRIEIEGQTLSIDGETQAQTTSTTIR